MGHLVLSHDFILSGFTRFAKADFLIPAAQKQEKEQEDEPAAHPQEHLCPGPLPEGRGHWGLLLPGQGAQQGLQVLRQLPHDLGRDMGWRVIPQRRRLAQGRRHSRRQGRRGQQGIRVFLTDSAQPFRRGRRDGAGKAKVHCGAQGVDVRPGALGPGSGTAPGGQTRALEPRSWICCPPWNRAQPKSSSTKEPSGISMMLSGAMSGG